MRVYRYVIANDAGSAPNYDPPHVTLAICKPQIRRCAAEGDLVLAFSGASLSPEPNGVRWAGVVSKKLRFAQYWKDPRFRGKRPGATEVPDNIYRPDRGGQLAQVDNPIHGVDNVQTDLRGGYVLVFDPAWNFGASEPVLPDRFGLRMVGARRNHRVSTISGSQWQALSQWLNDEEAAMGGPAVRTARSYRGFAPPKQIRKSSCTPKKSVAANVDSDLIAVLTPNDNPFPPNSMKAEAWRIVRGFGGCEAAECISALDSAGLVRRGSQGTGNGGFLREFHRRGLIRLEGYSCKPRC